MLPEHGVHRKIGGHQRAAGAADREGSGEAEGSGAPVPPEEDEHVFGGVGDCPQPAAEVGRGKGGEGKRMNPLISSNCSLGDNLSPDPRQVVTLKLVSRNPNPMPSRRKFRANLRVVWVNPRRKAA